MDFTREPIVETVITPREGCKLVLRNSKNTGQEEYFVDAVEVVSFGNSFFFRSMERPKAFLVPVADYEILEVRETRMVLKNVGMERSSIKIGGGREAVTRQTGRDSTAEKEKQEEVEEPKVEKKRDRRRHARRKRGREEKEEAKQVEKEDKVPSRKSPQLKGRGKTSKESPDSEQEASPSEVVDSGDSGDLSIEEQLGFSSPIFSTLLPPPSRLISETISQYRENDLFKGAFYGEGEEGEVSADESSEEETFTEEASTEEFTEAPAPDSVEPVDEAAEDTDLADADQAVETEEVVPVPAELAHMELVAGEPEPTTEEVSLSSKKVVAENVEASEEVLAGTEIAVEEVANGEQA